MYLKKLSLLMSIMFLPSYVFSQFTPHADRWDWKAINTKDITFGKHFLWGAAICEYQNSGAFHCDKNNWAHWENTTFANGKPHTVNGQKSGPSCNHWDLYRKDIELMKQLGLNSFRFSVEWSKIEPQEGTFDEPAIQHYVDFCNALLEAEIKPLITLHHFTHPQWFEDKGAFEHEENITYFVRFAKRVFEALGSKVHLWCTLNEPTIYAFQGYVRGVFPPGKKSFAELFPNQLAVHVLRNLMIAHTQVYKTLKAMPHGDRAQIGLVHQYLRFMPYTSWHLLEKLPGFALNHFLNDVVLNFCSTGTFKYNFYVPCIANIHAEYQAPEGPLLDFIGLNYYSRVLVHFKWLILPMSSCYPHEIMTDMPYAMYAQGLYEAIKDVARLRVPIYITENGIADEKDTKRKQFLKQYIYALSTAIRDGYDVRGFYYWSLTDNFEWDMGYTMRFGLYGVNFQTQERTLRKGSQYYAKVIRKAREGQLSRPFALVSPPQKESQPTHEKQA